jgi:hypothetical protein
MLTCSWRAIALGGACGIAVAGPLERVEPARRRQVPDTLPHLLDTVAGGILRVNGGLRTRARLVARDSVTWDSLWTRITADRVFVTEGDSMRPVRFPLPPVDFSRDMVIVVSQGPMPSLQYGTRIERVRVLGRELRVDVCNWRPSRDAVQFWEVPYPVDIVRVPRSALPVRFVDHRTGDTRVERRSSTFTRCLHGAQRPVRKDAGRSAAAGTSEDGRGGVTQRGPGDPNLGTQADSCHCARGSRNVGVRRSASLNEYAALSSFVVGMKAAALSCRSIACSSRRANRTP